VGVVGGRTVVDAVAELFSGKGSMKYGALAVLLSGPATVGVTTKVTVTVADLGMVPRSQTTVPKQLP
jgi:hypothetical protein